MPRHTLERLAAAEAALLARIPARGYVDERLAGFAQEMPEKAWADIFAGYIELLDEPSQRLEALRRTVFLEWYAWNEPYFLTGIQPFPTHIVESMYTALEKELNSPEPDPELLAMLHGYGPGLPFDLHTTYPRIAAFYANHTGPNSPNRPLDSMEGRGAMGSYWTSRRDVP
jgi:hypothetical protein